MRNLKIFTDNIEQEAIDQIHLLMAQEAFQNSIVRIMPDVHAGKGCVIGFTGDLGDKVIHNIVGVDIGCGMLCVSLGNKSMDLEKLDQIIHEKVPSGFHVHEGRNDRFPALLQLKSYRSLKDTRRFERSLGTLGGGNHFIEVDRDEEGAFYLVIHSGSRHLGLEAADYYQEEGYRALNGSSKKDIDELITELKQQGREKEIQKSIAARKKEQNTSIPKQLAYVSGDLFEQYIHDMKIIQKYADLNRQAMMDEILKGMKLHADWQFTTVHNYVDTEAIILRRGAVSARKGEKLLIPINMRDGSLICTGRGNDDWNQSAPHGAGRLMSRSAARQSFTVSEFKKQMKDIYTTSVNKDTLDECPMAYKGMEDIIGNIGDTAVVDKIIKPIYNFKSSREF